MSEITYGHDRVALMAARTGDWGWFFYHMGEPIRFKDWEGLV